MKLAGDVDGGINLIVPGGTTVGGNGRPFFHGVKIVKSTKLVDFL